MLLIQHGYLRKKTGVFPAHYRLILLTRKRKVITLCNLSRKAAKLLEKHHQVSIGN